MAAISSGGPGVLARPVIPPLDLQNDPRLIVSKMKDFEPKIHEIFTQTLKTQHHEEMNEGDKFCISIDQVLSNGVLCSLICGSKSYSYRISQLDVNQLKQLDPTDEEEDTIVQRIIQRMVNRWFKVKLWIESPVPMNPGDICLVIKEVVRERKENIVLESEKKKILKCWPRSALIDISQKESDIKNSMDLGIKFRLVLDCFAKKDEPARSWVLLGKEQSLSALQKEAFAQSGLPASESQSGGAPAKKQSFCIIS